MNPPFLPTAMILAMTAPAAADPAEIVDVVARPDPAGWTVSVTLLHTDTGWEDYANGWRVELPDGQVIATRTLSHPHVVEQPFTRSEKGVVIPAGTSAVVIRASTSPEGWGDDTRQLRIPPR